MNNNHKTIKIMLEETESILFRGYSKAAKNAKIRYIGRYKIGIGQYKIGNGRYNSALPFLIWRSGKTECLIKEALKNATP